MKPEKKQEHKEKLFENLNRRFAEVNERKATIEANYKKSMESVNDELDLLNVQKEALDGLK